MAIVFSGAAAVFSGCGSEETQSLDVPPPAPAAEAAPVVAAGAVPEPDAASLPPPSAAAAAPPVPVESQESEIADAEGKPMALLDYMNMSVQNYDRTQASMTEDDAWPPLTSLDVMVKVGFMKRLPTPPPGQKFHFDPRTMKVTLVPN